MFSKKFNNLGVTLDYKDDKKTVSDVETWPLVQSFALEGVGNGFFSMSKQILVDVMPLLQKLFLSPESRFYYDLLFKQTKTFENVFLQNVSLLFDKIKDESFKIAMPSDLAQIFLNKFEIDMCSLDYQGMVSKSIFNSKISQVN
jgi:hypothetical protein